MSYVFDSFEKNECLPKKMYLLQPTLKFDELPAGLEISTPEFSREERYRKNTRIPENCEILILIRGFVKLLGNVPTLIDSVRGCVILLAIVPTIIVSLDCMLPVSVLSMYNFSVSMQ